MEKIIQLVKSLNPREISTLKRFFKSGSKNQQNLRQELFHKIIQGKVSDDLTGARCIGKKPGDPAYIMLKKRLKGDILKVIVVDETSKTFSSKYFEAKFKCRLMIVEADMLLGRGITLMGEDILKDGIKLAEKYELTSEAIILYDLLQVYFGIKAGLEKYLEYSSKNKIHIILSQKKFEAQDYFRQLTMPHIFNSNKEYLYIEKSTIAIKELKKLANETNSDEIQSWYLRSNIFYSHSIGDYKKAREFAIDYLELVKLSPVIHCKDNVGGANMQLSIISIQLQEYSVGYKYAENAIKNFVNQSMNQVMAYAFLFLAALYDRQFNKAQEIFNRVEGFKLYKNHKPTQARWNYYRTHLLFAQGKYDESLALLQRENDLISDKSGWRIGFKILEMMNIIELGKYDWLDFRIETFRKLLSDVKNENITRPKLILQVIRNFIKYMYDFKATTAESKEILDLLESGTGDNRWDPIEYEITPFHVWWFNKIAADKVVA